MLVYFGVISLTTAMGHGDQPESVAWARVAQLVERLTCNEDVAGSTPVSGSIWYETFEKQRISKELEL
jgi:hypothetical protein